MLLAHEWEWFSTREREAAGMRVILYIILHMPVKIGKRVEEGVVYEYVGCRNVCLCVDDISMTQIQMSF